MCVEVIVKMFVSHLTCLHVVGIAVCAVRCMSGVAMLSKHMLTVRAVCSGCIHLTSGREGVMRTQSEEYDVTSLLNRVCAQVTSGSGGDHDRERDPFHAEPLVSAFSEALQCIDRIEAEV